MMSFAVLAGHLVLGQRNTGDCLELGE